MDHHAIAHLRNMTRNPFADLLDDTTRLMALDHEILPIGSRRVVRVQITATHARRPDTDDHLSVSRFGVLELSKFYPVVPGEDDTFHMNLLSCTAASRCLAPSRTEIDSDTSGSDTATHE
jgi:hypothetical protein